VSGVASVDAAGFDDAVIGAGRPVLVDFWAPRCGPCRMLRPILDKLARELSDVGFVAVDVDREPELAERFGVGAIPALVLFAHGRPARRIIGFHPERAVRSFVAGAEDDARGAEGR
jgi:thioredoxin 1